MSGLVGNTFAFFMFNGEEYVSTKVAQESNSGARWILELPGSDDGWSRSPHRHWRRSGSPPNFEVCQPRPRIDAFTMKLNGSRANLCIKFNAIHASGHLQATQLYYWENIAVFKMKSFKANYLGLKDQPAEQGVQVNGGYVCS